MAKKRKTKSKNAPKSVKRKEFLNEKEIGMDFDKKAYVKFDKMIKASVLFGSQAKNTASSSSDIDIILIIDDAAINWDLELISWYREELGKIISAQNYSKELHINTITLSTFFQRPLRSNLDFGHITGSQAPNNNLHSFTLFISAHSKEFEIGANFSIR